jgi:hypothetical protein
LSTETKSPPPGTAGGPGDPGGELVCPEGQIPDPNDPTKCIPAGTVKPDIITDEPIDITLSRTEASTKGMMAIIEKAINDATNEVYKRLEKQMIQKVTQIEAKVMRDAERALRKGLGLEVDPVLHLSDMPALLREHQLKQAAKSRRVPASPTDATPAGAAATQSEQSKAVEHIFKDYNKEAKA